MVNKYSVPCCKSGYDESSSSTSLHRFPSNPERASAWLRAINRDNFVVSKNSRVCSVHFLPTDFKPSSTDTNATRNNRRTSSSLDKKILKETAVPSVFPGQPKYLTISKPPVRSEASTSTARRANQEEHLQSLEDEMFRNDVVNDLNDF